MQVSAVIMSDQKIEPSSNSGGFSAMFSRFREWIKTLLARLSMTEKVVVSVLVAGGLCALVAFACQMSGWATADGRLLNVEMPLKGELVEVASVETGWVAAKDDEAMRQRTQLMSFPQVGLRLGKTRGEGELFVRFLDGKGDYAGDTVARPCKDGAFRSTESFYYESSGDRATVKCLDGFARKHDLDHHANAQDEPLWSVEISEKEPGKPVRSLGRVSIEPYRFVKP